VSDEVNETLIGRMTSEYFYGGHRRL